MQDTGILVTDSSLKEGHLAIAHFLDGEDAGGQGVGHEEVGESSTFLGQDGENGQVMVVLGQAQGRFEHGDPPFVESEPSVPGGSDSQVRS
ncbi:MAG: hypothetical protein MUO50_19380 [Longimicrobiales bacterium]|nr:hypothetical protein [Longimicrobiales bacterium]